MVDIVSGLECGVIISGLELVCVGGVSDLKLVCGDSKSDLELVCGVVHLT